MPFALKKRYMKVKSTQNALIFLQYLNCMSVAGEGHSFLDYSKAWVEKQNRGGLLLVNDNIFMLFKTGISDKANFKHEDLAYFEK